ncbi:MAG: aminotransferase class V-fold PLP-dependent enzyme [Gemmatimonadales bacterium]|jgi:isopenicillin-N epimerase
MSHRRAFLGQLAAVAGAASVGRFVAADRLLGASVQRVSTIVAGDRTEIGIAGDRDIRDEYLLGPGVVYLNHASIGTVPKAVQNAHKTYLDVCEENPWLYMWGGAWDDPREAVRAKAAAFVGCEAEDLALTRNTTEGFNVLAAGLPLGPGDEVLFSTLNHPGASICWDHHAQSLGFSVRRFEFPVLDVPSLSAADVVELHLREVGPRTRVMVFPHVDNVVGLRHPLRELAAAAHERGVEFVAVDGAQTVGMLPIALASSEVDFYAASPHKWVQAPKGSGLLYVRRAVRDQLRPLWVTWGQERWAGTARIYEDYGTRDLPGLLALGDAIDFQSAIGDRARREGLSGLRQALQTGVEVTPGLVWRSPESWEMGASLVAVEVEGLASPAFFERARRERGLVFRPFSTFGLNTVRISPNLITTREQIGVFLETAASAASDG